MCVVVLCVCVCARARVCVRTNICMRVYTHVRKQTCRGSTYLKAAVNLAPYPLPPTPYSLHPTSILHPTPAVAEHILGLQKKVELSQHDALRLGVEGEGIGQRVQLLLYHL